MLRAGVARVELTPFWGVELTGWGYYIQRRWQAIRDPLFATALVCDDGRRSALLLTLDLMLVDEPFVRATRQHIAAATGIPPHAVLITCSHSHNAPAAGGLLGVGECDPLYERWASRQAATAAVLAWQRREPVSLRIGHSRTDELTFNRTRPQGLIDPNLTVLAVDRLAGRPLAVVVNFAAHPTVATELHPLHVSRDIPGVVCDELEAALPGAVAMYVQGACGDVNFHRHFATTQRWREPGQELARLALQSLEGAVGSQPAHVAAACRQVTLPTRRWTREEIEQDRAEAQRRLASGDIGGWRETIGRSMTNRPDDMVRRHGGNEAAAVAAMCRFHLEWTERMLRDFEQRPEALETEVQALQFGQLRIVSNAAELFSPFALEVRRAQGNSPLMVACYANGRIGYLPDEYDIARRSYAGYQSPKYCNQFPFVPESGPAMCRGMLDALSDMVRERGV